MYTIKALRAHLLSDPNQVGYGQAPEADPEGTSVKLNDPTGVTTLHDARQRDVWSVLDRALRWGKIAKLADYDEVTIATKYTVTPEVAERLSEFGRQVVDMRGDPLSDTLDVNDPAFTMAATLFVQVGILDAEIVEQVQALGRTVESDGSRAFGVPAIPLGDVRIALAVDPWLTEETPTGTRRHYLDGRTEESDG